MAGTIFAKFTILMWCVLSKMLGRCLLLAGLVLSACVADPWPEPDDGVNQDDGEEFRGTDGAADGVDGGLKNDASVGDDGEGSDGTQGGDGTP